MRYKESYIGRNKAIFFLTFCCVLELIVCDWGWNALLTSLCYLPFQKVSVLVGIWKPSDVQQSLRFSFTRSLNANHSALYSRKIPTITFIQLWQLFIPGPDFIKILYTYLILYNVTGAEASNSELWISNHRLPDFSPLRNTFRRTKAWILTTWFS